MEQVRKYWTPEFLLYDQLKHKLLEASKNKPDDLAVKNQFLKCYNAVHMQMCVVLGASMRGEPGPIPHCKQYTNSLKDIHEFLNEAPPAPVRRYKPRFQKA